MNVLSLFSGIGGIDLGLERLGCTTVAHSVMMLPAEPHRQAMYEQEQARLDELRVAAGAFRYELQQVLDGGAYGEA